MPASAGFTVNVQFHEYDSLGRQIAEHDLNNVQYGAIAEFEPNDDAAKVSMVCQLNTAGETYGTSLVGSFVPQKKRQTVSFTLNSDTTISYSNAYWENKIKITIGSHIYPTEYKFEDNMTSEDGLTVNVTFEEYDSNECQLAKYDLENVQYGDKKGFFARGDAEKLKCQIQFVRGDAVVKTETSTRSLIQGAVHSIILNNEGIVSYGTTIRL